MLHCMLYEKSRISTGVYTGENYVIIDILMDKG